MALPLASDRRNSTDDSVAALLKAKKRFFDAKENVEVVKLFSGDWYVSRRSDEMLVTILGSCVSTCIRDPIAQVGGMNHFLLPGEGNQDSRDSDSARYGVHAMESLINGLLKIGARKDRFEIKVFGGGNVTRNSARIGSKNAQFIRNFLHKEGLPITSDDLEGEYARRIHFYPTSGKVMMRLLRRKEDLVIVEEEQKYRKSIINTNIEGTVDLF